MLLRASAINWRPLIVAAVILMMNGAIAQAQWIVSAYAGLVRTSPADLEIVQPALGTSLVFPDVPFRSRSFESPIYYGYRIARAVPFVEWLYIEAELIHAKLYADIGGAGVGAGQFHGKPEGTVRFESVVQEFALSHGLNFILANALFRRTVAATPMTLSGRLGIGPILPHREIEVERRRVLGYELAGNGVQVSGGIEVRVWRRLAVMAEYKWTRTRPRLSLADGTATVTATSHHLAFGLATVF